MKKKNSKRMGIKLISSLNDNIYFFSNSNHNDEEYENYLELEDNDNKLNERINNLDNILFIDDNTNKTISLKKSNKVSTYENKYSIKKDNIINEALLNKYTNNQVDTNLVIQIIHNNEDIKKIVGLYINDVVFSLSNITPSFDRDAITKITTNYYYDELEKKIKVGNSLYRYPDLKELLNTLRTNKFLYGFSNTNDKVLFEHIKSVSLFRNYIFHDNMKMNYSKDIEFELNKYIEIKGKEFLKNNTLNVSLISKLYGTDNNEEIAKYYEYVLNSLDKNLGISIKKIVELYLSRNKPLLDEEQMKKYHVIIKYHLFNIIKNNQELTNKYIEKLREADYDNKEAIYNSIIEEIGNEEFLKVEKICSDIDFKEKNHINIQDITLNKYKDIWTAFTLNIYSLTKFLTIKETNELISSIITKLESIKDLLMASLKMQINIGKEIKSELLIVNFDDLSDQINQLRIINSIKKFTSPKHSKSSMDFLKQGLSIFKHDDIDLEPLLTNKYDNSNLKAKRIKYPVKNFVRNNVINTKFFNYILRYADPNKVSNILYKKPKLVEYLLSNLPQTQIEKYKNSKDLPLIISNMTLKSINDSLKNGNLEYIKYTNLYLTCLYFLIKNINRINGYYFIALAFYVRDYQLINKVNPFDKNTFNDFLSLTNLTSFNSSDKKAINNSINNFKKMPIKNFINYRNIIAHCNIIGILTKTEFPDDFEYKNYFKIYQYCLQKEVLSLVENEYNSSVLENINKYHKYSKNFLFTMNSPLMYNYSRYKNISDENIFMRLYDDKKE